MSKKRNARFGARGAEMPETHPTLAPAPMPGVEAFTFGDPVAVLDKREILSYLECMRMSKWYEPPISWEGLARSFRAAPHHSSAIYVKRNILASTFIPHKLLSRAEFKEFALNYLVFGNAYLELRKNRLGGQLALKALLTKYTRRSLDLQSYWWVPEVGQETQFEKGDVFHLMGADIEQEVYGLPEYLSALNAAWLNESATLFRRRYYKNGSHAGFILYMTDAAQSQGDVDALRTALKDSKGPGNFRNLFMYAPNGKKDGMQIIPVSEVAAKDEFFNIKNVTRDDLLAAHRVPPQLMSVIPNNTSGFGDVEKAAKVFGVNEIVPLQDDMKAVNDWLGEEVMRFQPYALTDGEQAT
ncbi:phage portal protein [Pandoraea apista]|uniref:phage portal protein n=1 Tax=Pandoraea apista TaxID=93218 RepID=UPI0026891844